MMNDTGTTLPDLPALRANAMRATANASDTPAVVQPTSRRPWADSAKGVGILCVILVHTVNGLKSPGIMPSGTAWDFWSDWLYTFQVPVFFFVAGLFANASYERLGFRKFLETRLAALAYPYIVWRTLQILIMLAAGGSTNAQVSPWTLLTFPFESFMQFWFLYVLMLIIAIYALLKVAGLSSRAMLVIAAGMLLLPQASWPAYNSLCASMIYFAGGLVLQDRLDALQRVRPVWLLLAAAACAGGVTLFVREGVLFGTPWRPLPATLGITAVMLISFVGVRWKWWESVCLLGRYSLELYVAHTTFAAGMRIFLVKLLHIESLPVHVCLGIAVSIAGPLALVLLQKRSVRFRIPLFRTTFASA